MSARAIEPMSKVSTNKLRTLLLGAASLAAVAGAAASYLGAAQAQIAVQNQGYIPYSDAPIYYRSARSAIRSRSCRSSSTRARRS